MYKVKFLQVIDDMMWDSDRLTMAFPGLVVMQSSQASIHTALDEATVIQRIDNTIDFKFRVYYDNVKRVFKVRHPPRQRRRHPSVAPPSSYGDTVAQRHYKGKGKGKEQSQGQKRWEPKKQQKATLKPRPWVPWRAHPHPPSTPPPFTVWQPTLAASRQVAQPPALRAPRPRPPARNLNPVKNAQTKSPEAVMKAKPTSRATQTAKAAPTASPQSPTLIPSSVSCVLRSMANLIDDTARPSTAPTLRIQDMQGQDI